MSLWNSRFRNLYWSRLRAFSERHFPWFTAAFVRCAESALFGSLDISISGPSLDVGCGDGSFAHMTFVKPLDVGIDLRIESGVRGTSAYKHVVAADVRYLPFPDGAFRTIVGNSTLEHVEGAQDGMKEISRVLTHGGVLIFSVPCSEINHYFWVSRMTGVRNPYLGEYHSQLNHINILSLQDWQKMCSDCGLEVVEFRYYVSRGLAFFHTMFAQFCISPLPWRKSSGHMRGIDLLNRLINRRLLRPVFIWSLENIMGRFYSRDLKPHELGAYLFIVARRSARAQPIVGTERQAASARLPA